MNFKDFSNQDLKTFVNSDEFADTHTIDGRILNVIVDNDRLMERSKKEYDGISVGELLYFVEVSAFGAAKPKPKDAQRFDNKLLYIFDVREDLGMYEIILSQNRGE